MTGRKFVATSLKHVWAGAVIVATMLVVGGCALPGTEPPAPPSTPTPAASPAVTRLPPATFTAVASKEVGPAATRVAAPAARAVATPSPVTSPEAAQLSRAPTPAIPGWVAARATRGAGAVATARVEAAVTVEVTVEVHRLTPCATGVDPMRAYASAAPLYTHVSDVAASGRRWTADGSRILIAHNAEVWAVMSDGSRLWRISEARGRAKIEGVPPPTSIGWMTSFDVTSDGKHVVYTTCWYPPAGASTSLAQLDVYDFNYELAVVGLDGQDPRRLTRHRAFDNYPAWSPDGTRIAFVSDQHLTEAEKRRSRWPPPGLFTMAADGRDIRRIATDLTVAWQPPAWSPDGRSLAVAAAIRYVGSRTMAEGFWAFGAGDHALYVVPADGAGFVRLSEAVSGGAWSPDGTRLAFAKPEGAEVALYTIAADGSDAQRVTTIPRLRTSHGTHATRGWIHTIAWSPDGSKLLYACGDRQFCVVTLDGQPVNERCLGGAEGPVCYRYGKDVGTSWVGDRAVWSSDGARIAVTLRPKDRAYNRIVLYSAAPDGSDRRTLAWGGVGLVAAQAKDEGLATSRAACTAGFVVPAPDANPGLVRDCETLLAARAELFGRLLVNWGSGSPLARWEGVTVAGAPPRVTGLELRDRYLGFSLSETRGGMSIGSPGHGGTIPPTLGALERLQHLDLSGNTLTGPIPPELENLTHLKELRLHNYGHLTGCIPAGLRPVPDNDLAELGLPDCEAGA